jgi:hypothetical protein
MTVGFAGRTWLLLVVALAYVAAPSVASHAQQADIACLPRKLLTAAHAALRSAYERPSAITVVHPDSAPPGQRHLTIDERSSLLRGVRGVRVLRDGLPLTLADGRPLLDSLDLESVGRVRAIRSSASVLYGNADGRAIELRVAAPSHDRTVVRARGTSASVDPQRRTGMAARSADALGYQGSTTLTAWSDVPVRQRRVPGRHREGRERP